MNHSVGCTFVDGDNKDDAFIAIINCFYGLA